MLNVRHLEVFRTVVKAGSVSAAARMLYVSQPAVTKTLHLLEEELGLTLFLRVRGRLICTPEAELLIPEVERLFGSVQSVAQRAAEIRQGERGTITIAAVSTLAMSMVARAIGVFRREHPQVLFDVRALPTRHVVEYVNTNQADLGILDVPTPSGALEVEEFCEGEVSCVLRASHPLARHKALTPALLAGQTLVSFGEDTISAWRFREAFKAAGVQYETALVSNSTVTLCAMVAEIDAIALVDPFTLMSHAFPDLITRRFRPRLELRPRFLFSPGRPRSLIVGQFVQTLRQVAVELAQAERP